MSIAELAPIRRVIAEREAEVEKARAMVEELETLFSASTATATKPAGKRQSKRRGARRVGRPSGTLRHRTQALAKTVTTVLREKKHPMSAPEIRAELSARRTKVSIGQLYRLLRKGAFKRVSRGKYAPVEAV